MAKLTISTEGDNVITTIIYPWMYDLKDPLSTARFLVDITDALSEARINELGLAVGDAGPPPREHVVYSRLGISSCLHTPDLIIALNEILAEIRNARDNGMRVRRIALVLHTRFWIAGVPVFLKSEPSVDPEDYMVWE